MAASLPTKLRKEPLIDAIFEVRFVSEIPASFVIPGILFSTLEGNKKLDSLPIAQVPKVARDADPNLKYAPINRIDWDEFFVNIGDHSLSISSKYPYVGWSKFKPAILKVIDALNSSNIVQSIERCAIKYIDMLPNVNIDQASPMVNLKLAIAGHELEKEPFQIRIEIPRDGYIHAVQIVSSAKAKLHSGETIEGLIVDTDTISNQNNIPMTSFIDGLDEKLEAIHASNKTMFFDCISSRALESLEPIYE